MNAAAITTLVTDTIGDFSSSALTIVTAVIAVGLAFLLFRWGWKKVKGSMH
jgi:phosphate/sulfate permease